jgi:trans-aconitate methyltransferase
VSWYEPNPATSMEHINALNLNKDAFIIDIGGGDSLLVDHLLKNGFTNVSVLDISQAAIDKAKNRLGELATRVTWLVSDIVNFKPEHKYDLWHDRAAFHFLTTTQDIEKYIQIATQSLNENGTLFIGTFSTLGPKKCSGIDIQQYSETTMETIFAKHFDKIKCIETEHKTPFETLQNFVFCSFKKKQ